MYLQGALKTYLAEGWALLVTHTRKQLAECQKQLGQIEKYPLTGRARAIKTGKMMLGIIFLTYLLTVKTARYSESELRHPSYLIP